MVLLLELESTSIELSSLFTPVLAMEESEILMLEDP